MRAWITRYPSRSSGNVSSFWIDSSSSTSMIVASVATPWILERALYGKGACYKGACLAPVERLDAERPARPRRRTLISWPLYRLVLAVSVVPLLLAVLLVRQPTLPPTPTRSLSFDGGAAATQSAGLLALPKGWAPGQPGDHAAAGAVVSKLRKYGYHIQTQSSAPTCPAGPTLRSRT